MSSRTYLSIGDVLTLLREEFPDVTISKIRFLESQGLVNPERSPSGYRKFFEHDVERLRWVLRQQREHFLPLKVIRDRLADGELDDEPSQKANGKPAEPRAGPHVAPAASPDDEQPTKADEEAMARIFADASRRTARLPEAAQARGGCRSSRSPRHPRLRKHRSRRWTAPRHARRRSRRRLRRWRHRHGRGGGREGPRARRTPLRRTRRRPRRNRPAHGRDARPQAGAAPATATPAAPALASAAPPVAPAVAAAATTTSMVTGASLTARGARRRLGTVTRRGGGAGGLRADLLGAVAGMQTYDEEALAVANLAAAFRAFGIEPRHLRLYRNAVDREMGLIEQVVIPLLRQRNPESRQRAAEGADQLAALGQSMRASLLRQALRQHLGG